MMHSQGKRMTRMLILAPSAECGVLELVAQETTSYAATLLLFAGGGNGGCLLGCESLLVVSWPLSGRSRPMEMFQIPQFILQNGQLDASQEATKANLGSKKKKRTPWQQLPVRTRFGKSAPTL